MFDPIDAKRILALNWQDVLSGVCKTLVNGLSELVPLTWQSHGKGIGFLVTKARLEKDT